MALHESFSISSIRQKIECCVQPRSETLSSLLLRQTLSEYVGAKRRFELSTASSVTPSQRGWPRMGFILGEGESLSENTQQYPAVSLLFSATLSP